MGWGDDMMWLGEANEEHLKNPDALIFTDQPYSVMWDNIPWITSADYRGSKKKIFVPTKPNGNRWYIQGWAPGRIIYKEYKPKRAPYTFSSDELYQGYKDVKHYIKRPFVIINPDTKNTTLANNKDWGMNNWQKLVDLLHPYVDVVRLKPPKGIVDVSGQVNYNQPSLNNVIELLKENIRRSFAIARYSEAIITSEGGLHHFAAAIHKKAFVLYGGVIGPKQTGYEGQTQYYSEDPLAPCGYQTPCKHCKACMELIDPFRVYQDVMEYLNGKNICSNNV